MESVTHLPERKWANMANSTKSTTKQNTPSTTKRKSSIQEKNRKGSMKSTKADSIKVDKQSTVHEDMRLTVRIDDDLARRLERYRALAALTGEQLSTSDVIRRSLDTYLTEAFSTLLHLAQQELTKEIDDLEEPE